MGQSWLKCVSKYSVSIKSMITSYFEPTSNDNFHIYDGTFELETPGVVCNYGFNNLHCKVELLISTYLISTSTYLISPGAKQAQSHLQPPWWPTTITADIACARKSNHAAYLSRYSHKNTLGRKRSGTRRSLCQWWVRIITIAIILMEIQFK